MERPTDALDFEDEKSQVLLGTQKIAHEIAALKTILETTYAADPTSSRETTMKDHSDYYSNNGGGRDDAKKPGDDITERVGNGRSGFIVDEKSTKLQKEICRTGFRIFECISDLGYFSWNPPPANINDEPSYVSLSNVSNIDQLMIPKYLDLNGKPDILVNPSRIQTPVAFMTSKPSSLPWHGYKNMFPYGKLDMICLYVASKYRGIDFDRIDFVFGGSTLEMLAWCDGSKPYMVTRIPGAGHTILVSKNYEYEANLSDIGYQFERLMTGRGINDSASHYSSVGHLHVMDVGPFRVLFRAEIDAVMGEDDDTPVEIKTANPFFFGTRVMFQMISNGSMNLCHGIKSNGSLEAVQLHSLYQVSQMALAQVKTETLERNIRTNMYASRKKDIAILERTIVTNMKEIDSQMRNKTPGDVFQIFFDDVNNNNKYGSLLRLLPMRGLRHRSILPPPSIVRKLLARWR